MGIYRPSFRDALSNFVLHMSRNLPSHLCELNHEQISCCDQLSDVHIQKTSMNNFPLVSVHNASSFHFFRMFFNRVLALTFFTISTRTVPFLSSMPKTIVLFLAPRPRFPLRFLLKYTSSSSNLPLIVLSIFMRLFSIA